MLTILLPAAGEAGVSTREVRALIKCRTGVTRAAVSYTHRLDWRVGACLRQLQECRLARRSPCWPANAHCANAARDLAAFESEMRNRVAAACAALPTSGLREQLGFSTPMSDCVQDSVDDFASCLAEHVRRMQAELTVRVDPMACDVLGTAGLADLLPEAACSPDDGGGEPPPEPSAPLACGGEDDLTCPDGFVCDRTDALCTQPAPSGRCVPMDGCVADSVPVCGCDGQTHASDCDRLAAGATKRHDGSCAPPPQVCTFSNPSCPSGTFCDFPSGDCGEGGQGEWRPLRADDCNLCSAFVEGPVCGCDFVTYASECDRLAAGVSEWFRGSCQ
jgi:hypothetical protein